MPLLSGRDPRCILQAAKHLAAGGLLGFPTETVYGLGARADVDTAAAGIFAAKGRPVDHPLIVHVTGVEAAHDFAASWPASAEVLAQRFWPGPLTLVVPRRPAVAGVAAAGLPTVALRCPDHPVALALLREAAGLGVRGLAGPSANRFGRVSPTRASHVVDEFGDSLMVLDGGPCREGIESAIVDVSREEPVLLRPGTLTRAHIEAALRRDLAVGLRDRDAQAPRVPGSLAAHYAPRARVHLVPADRMDDALQALGHQHDGRSVGVYSRQPPRNRSPIVHRAMSGDPSEVAHDLFAVLRGLDDEGVQAIWVEMPPEGTAWDGVRDRLQRAATR